MKKYFILILICFVSFFTSCLGSGEEESQLHTLDSLSGALQTKVQELKMIDSVSRRAAILKFENYRLFIKQNVNDTLNVQQGDLLQKFFLCGKNLMEFNENRKSLMARSELLNSQINKLSTDIKNGTAEYSKTQIYLNQEISGVKELTKKTYGQQKAFERLMEQFNLILPGIEEVLKSKNAGVLPLIEK
ncbi:MAG: hypothetical protein IPM51_08300 [Sphingobacteriaceae bacterium]|nr:hypothetical protein [Sphingobacteriaceae bacterium]